MSLNNPSVQYYSGHYYQCIEDKTKEALSNDKGKNFNLSTWLLNNIECNKVIYITKNKSLTRLDIVRDARESLLVDTANDFVINSVDLVTVIKEDYNQNKFEISLCTVDEGEREASGNWLVTQVYTFKPVTNSQIDCPTSVCAVSVLVMAASVHTSWDLDTVPVVLLSIPEFKKQVTRVTHIRMVAVSTQLLKLIVVVIVVVTVVHQ